MRKRSIQGASRPVDLNVTEWEVFMYAGPASTLQLIFKKLSLVEIWCCIIEEYPQLPRQAVKILLPFVTMSLCKTEILHILQPKQHITAPIKSDV